MSPPDPSKRLAYLEQLAATGKADSFARYALALEYRNAGRTADALSAFEALRAVDDGYVPMYLMAGQMLIEAGHRAEARVWLEAGLVVARAKGDGHALGEIEGLLGQLA